MRFPTKTKPWEHQVRAFEFAKDKDAAMLALEMGCGKSLVTLALLNHWDCQRILIVCPLSVVGVWNREFDRHVPGDFVVHPLNKGTVTKRMNEMKSFVRLAKARGAAAVVTINYDSYWRAPMRAAIEGLGFDAVVYDECHRLKTAGGKSSVFASKLRDIIPKRLGLTGTPMPHSPRDIYAQFRALDTSVFGKSKNRFELKYCIKGGYQGHQIVGYQNQDEMKKNLDKLSIRVTKEEALDLPEQTHVQREFSLGSDCLEKYKSMESNFFAEVETGEVNAANAMVKLLRLQQITSGFLKDDDGNTAQLGDGKKDLLAAILEDIPVEKPVVVFCRFRQDLEAVRDVAHQLGRVHGEISGSQRDLTDHSTMPDSIQMMGVQIQSGGVGIDLTAASIAVYYSIGFSLGDFDQSLSRLHRPGQRHPVTFYHLVATDTVDVKVYKALEQRKNVVDAILNMEV